MIVRAKFRCTTDTQQVGYPDTQHRYTFAPVYQPDVPEDQRFAKSTPQGEAWMVVDNPAVRFEVGEYYYLDFVKVPADEL